MNKKTLMIMAMVGALALTSCGGKKDDARSAGDDSLVTTDAPSTSGDFGKALDLGSGVKVTISAPKTFSPGTFASNYLPGQVANVFDVTIANAGTAALDPSTIAFASESGANTCSDVLDGDNGVSGAPTDAIGAGSSVNFKIAVGCDAKSGAPLHLTITIGAQSAAVDGKIA